MPFGNRQSPDTDHMAILTRLKEATTKTKRRQSAAIKRNHLSHVKRQPIKTHFFPKLVIIFSHIHHTPRAKMTKINCNMAPAEAINRINISGSLNHLNSCTASGGGVVGAITIATSTTEIAYANTANIGRRICL